MRIWRISCNIKSTQLLFIRQDLRHSGNIYVPVHFWNLSLLLVHSRISYATQIHSIFFVTFLPNATCNNCNVSVADLKIFTENEDSTRKLHTYLCYTRISCGNIVRKQWWIEGDLIFFYFIERLWEWDLKSWFSLKNVCSNFVC